MLEGKAILAMHILKIHLTESFQALKATRKRLRIVPSSQRNTFPPANELSSEYK
jgi:hypothetical protein